MAWQQELWRRQRVHLAALEEDVEMEAGHPNYVVRFPPSVVAPASGAGRERMKRLHSPRQKKKEKQTQHNDHRKLQRSNDDLHIGQAAQRKKNKNKKEHKAGRHKKANVEDEEEEEAGAGVIDVETTPGITPATRQKKKRSRSLRWAEKIKHMARSESFSDEDEATEAEADQQRLRRERSPSDEVFDLGAHQVHALAWYQRLRAAGHPQRNA
jgi:hypothetical protein